jgi:hypothetical protein
VPASGAALGLAARFARLPPAPPAPTGAAIVVVVGRRRDALAVADRLADEDRTGTTRVLLATSRPTAEDPPWALVPDAGAAVDLARRRPTERTVVAVDLAPGARALAWAQRMIAALRPDQVRMTVPADADPTDSSATIQLLGGVDVLDVAEPDRTVSPIDPGALLSLGAPVATVAGLPATAGLWAALSLTHADTAERSGGGRSGGERSGG